MVIKPNARILDATAANRMMWKTNDHPGIMFIDVEKELEYVPDKFMDCTKTDFPDEYFNMILFDPPHNWGIPKNKRLFSIPSNKVAQELFGRNTCYYGLDKFNNKRQLVRFIYDAQEEFKRILNPYGCLWVKWSEYRIMVEAIEPLFRDWSMMMKIRLHKTAVGKNDSWWIMYMKNNLKDGGKTE